MEEQTGTVPSAAVIDQDLPEWPDASPERTPQALGRIDHVAVRSWGHGQAPGTPAVIG